MARRTPGRRQVTPFSGLPDWLAIKVTAQRQGWAAGQLRSCLHDPKPGRTVHMCAWKPELVTCPDCTHLFVTVETGDRCDACERDTAGTENDHTEGFRMRVGDITYWAVVCPPCKKDVTRA